jgi:hypothetical protein
MRSQEEIEKRFRDMGLLDKNKSKRFLKRDIQRTKRNAEKKEADKEYIFIRFANKSKVIGD